MKKIKVYRNGSLTPATYEGDVAEFAQIADAAKPKGRAGRMGSLYASPTLAGNLRWIMGNMNRRTMKVQETYEVILDADTAYVYDVEKWEDHSWRGTSVESYWESGITLSEWMERADEMDARNWEVLFTPDAIIGTPRRVTRKRILDANTEDNENLVFALKHTGIR